MKKIILFLLILFYPAISWSAVASTTGVFYNAITANVNPLASPWTKASAIADELQIVSNEIVGTGASGANNAQYWSGFTYQANAGEFYATIATVASLTSDDVILLIINPSTLNGYGLLYTSIATNNIKIERITGGTQAGTTVTFTQAISTGDALLLKPIGGVISCWYKASGGSWVLLGSLSDSTYSITGMNPAILMRYTTTSQGLTNIGGGNPSKVGFNFGF